ncbi:MAG: hypothetical protein ACE15B_14900 [Bryobacteraceae bacterium]
MSPGIAVLFCIGLAPPPVTVTPDVRAAGVEIPADFLGLSFETSNLLPQPGGEHLFASANHALISLFRTLGIRSLRMGGNTADMPRYAVPGESDADQLFAFAAAAGVKVIYTLRLPGGDPGRNAAIAGHIQRRYREQLTCFAIGNEPDYYRKVYPEIPDYAAFRAEWKKMAAAVTDAAPGAKFCGPATGGITAWTRSFAEEFGHMGLIHAITQHYYPGGDGTRVTDAAGAREQMLSPAWIERHYDAFYRAFAPAAASSGLPYRLEETNNFTGGARDASDTFTSALWALDYLHWWAAHGAAGINFHNRRWILNTTIYPGSTRDDGLKSGYSVHPIAYGIKAFDVGGRGAEVPVAVANPDVLNLSAYAVRDAGNLFVTIINKDACEADVTIAAPGISGRGAVMYMRTGEGDVAAKAGITLGGAPIESGSWTGEWSPLPSAAGGRLALKAPPASAAIVRLPRNQAGRLAGRRNPQEGKR